MYDWDVVGTLNFRVTLFKAPSKTFMTTPFPCILYRNWLLIEWRSKQAISIYYKNKLKKQKQNKQTNKQSFDTNKQCK